MTATLSPFPAKILAAGPLPTGTVAATPVAGRLLSPAVGVAFVLPLAAMPDAPAAEAAPAPVAARPGEHDLAGGGTELPAEEHDADEDPALAWIPAPPVVAPPRPIAFSLSTPALSTAGTRATAPDRPEADARVEASTPSTATFALPVMADVASDMTDVAATLASVPAAVATLAPALAPLPRGPVALSVPESFNGAPPVLTTSSSLARAVVAGTRTIGTEPAEPLASPAVLRAGQSDRAPAAPPVVATPFSPTLPAAALLRVTPPPAKLELQAPAPSVSTGPERRTDIAPASSAAGPASASSPIASGANTGSTPMTPGTFVTRPATLAAPIPVTSPKQPMPAAIQRTTLSVDTPPAQQEEFGANPIIVTPAARLSPASDGSAASGTPDQVRGDGSRLAQPALAGPPPAFRPSGSGSAHASDQQAVMARTPAVTVGSTSSPVRAGEARPAPLPVGAMAIEPAGETRDLATRSASPLIAPSSAQHGLAPSAPALTQSGFAGPSCSQTSATALPPSEPAPPGTWLAFASDFRVNPTARHDVGRAAVPGVGSSSRPSLVTTPEASVAVQVERAAPARFAGLATASVPLVSSMGAPARVSSAPSTRGAAVAPALAAVTVGGQALASSKLFASLSAAMAAAAPVTAIGAELAVDDDRSSGAGAEVEPSTATSGVLSVSAAVAAPTVFTVEDAPPASVEMPILSVATAAVPVASTGVAPRLAMETPAFSGPATVAIAPEAGPVRDSEAPAFVPETVVEIEPDVPPESGRGSPVRAAVTAPAAYRPAFLVAGRPEMAPAGVFARVSGGAGWRDVREATRPVDPASPAALFVAEGPRGIDVQSAPLELGDRQWPARMMDRIEALRDAADAADTSIRLAPDALGAVEVSLRRDGDTVHVHFSAEQAATRVLLQDAQPRLAELAGERGLKLGQSSVGGGEGQGREQPAQQTTRTPPAPARGEAATITNDDHRIA